jgi:hypothetical protein
MTEFWRRWLIVAAATTGLAGLGFAVLTATGAIGIHNTIFDLVFLPGEMDALAGDAGSFAMGVTGAVLVGWSSTMLVLLASRSTSSLLDTWRALAIGLLVWFVVDGIVSIGAGALGNLVLNLGFVVLFAPPLIATRPGAGSSTAVMTPHTPT